MIKHMNKDEYNGIQNYLNKIYSAFSLIHSLSHILTEVDVDIMDLLSVS